MKPELRKAKLTHGRDWHRWPSWGNLFLPALPQVLKISVTWANVVPFSFLKWLWVGFQSLATEKALINAVFKIKKLISKRENQTKASNSIKSVLSTLNHCLYTFNSKLGWKYLQHRVLLIFHFPKMKSRISLLNTSEFKEIQIKEQ